MAQMAKHVALVVLLCTICYCSAAPLEQPTSDLSQSDLLHEIGLDEQQPEDVVADDARYVIQASDSLLLPSAQHDGIPLDVEDWPVHPEYPVDSYESLLNRLTDAVESSFPERLDDYAEAQRRAAVGIMDQTPILEPSAGSTKSSPHRPSIMSEVEDLLMEVSHHGLMKGAEVQVEGSSGKFPNMAMLEDNACAWVIVGWLGTMAVFAIPAGLVYLYGRCTGYDICSPSQPKKCKFAHPEHRCNHGGGSSPNAAAAADDDDDDNALPAGGAGQDPYFVVHPYGDTNMAPASYRVDYPSVIPVQDSSSPHMGSNNESYYPYR